jgi:hypothetical protein
MVSLQLDEEAPRNLAHRVGPSPANRTRRGGYQLGSSNLIKEHADVLMVCDVKEHQAIGSKPEDPIVVRGPMRDSGIEPVRELLT